TAGPDGNVWFTEVAGKVGYVTPVGGVTEFSLGSGIHSRYITAGADGALWFTASGSNNTNYVDRITTGGTLTQYTMPSGASLGDITTGSDGRVWLVSGTRSITAMATNGNYSIYTWPLGPN